MEAGGGSGGFSVPKLVIVPEGPGGGPGPPGFSGVPGVLDPGGGSGAVSGGPGDRACATVGHGGAVVGPEGDPDGATGDPEGAVCDRAGAAVGPEGGTGDPEGDPSGRAGAADDPDGDPSGRADDNNPIEPARPISSATSAGSRICTRLLAEAGRLCFLSKLEVAERELTILWKSGRLLTAGSGAMGEWLSSPERSSSW